MSTTHSDDLLFSMAQFENEGYRIVFMETRREIRIRLIRDYGFDPEKIQMATYPPEQGDIIWQEIAYGLKIPPEYLK